MQVEGGGGWGVQAEPPRWAGGRLRHLGPCLAGTEPLQNYG